MAFYRKSVLSFAMKKSSVFTVQWQNTALSLQPVFNLELSNKCLLFRVVWHSVTIFLISFPKTDFLNFFVCVFFVAAKLSTSEWLHHYSNANWY